MTLINGLCGSKLWNEWLSVMDGVTLNVWNIYPIPLSVH